MRRNLVQSLIEHGEIRTTLPKAKDIRPFAEKLVQLAMDGGLAARQRAIALLSDRAIIPSQYQADYDKMRDAKREKVLRARSGRRNRLGKAKGGLPFTAESVIHRLFSDIGPKMKERNQTRHCAGGYTRIIKLADRRVGDAGPLALLQWVGKDDKPRPKSSAKTQRKRKAAARYAAYAGKQVSRRGPRRAKSKKESAEPSS